MYHGNKYYLAPCTSHSTFIGQWQFETGQGENTLKQADIINQDFFPLRQQLIKHFPAHHWDSGSWRCGKTEVVEVRHAFAELSHGWKGTVGLCMRTSIRRVSRCTTGVSRQHWQGQWRGKQSVLPKAPFILQMKKCILNDGFSYKLSQGTLEVIQTVEKNTVQVARKENNVT